MTAEGGRPLPASYFAVENLSPDKIKPGQRPSGSIVTPGAVFKVPLEAE